MHTHVFAFENPLYIIDYRFLDDLFCIKTTINNRYFSLGSEVYMTAKIEPSKEINENGPKKNFRKNILQLIKTVYTNAKNKPLSYDL